MSLKRIKLMLILHSTIKIVYHYLTNPASILYNFQDGSIHTGFVEDVDLKSDLATLRIPVKGLPVMKLGSSSDIQPGEWVCSLF